MRPTACASTVIAFLAIVSGTSISRAQLPDAIASPGEVAIVTLHAEGAQIYECKADSGGKLVWQFREPIAALILDGKIPPGGITPVRIGSLPTAVRYLAKCPLARPGATARRTFRCSSSRSRRSVKKGNSRAPQRSRGSIPRAVRPKARVRPAAPSRACPIRPTTRSSRKEAERGLRCLQLVGRLPRKFSRCACEMT